MPSYCTALLAAAALAALPRDASPDECETKPAASIDVYLSATPLKNLGYVFVGWGHDYNVDPRFIVALAGAETSFGRNITWGSYNAWKWGWSLKNQKNSPFISFAYGISLVTGGIRNLYWDRGTTSTSTVYLGAYCNGPDCPNGLKNINTFLTAQGGNPSDLTFPCKKKTNK